MSAFHPLRTFGRVSASASSCRSAPARQARRPSAVAPFVFANELESRHFMCNSGVRRAAALVGGSVANAFLHGTVHEAAEDLQAAVGSNPKIVALWENLTPLGRNEFICWVDDAKRPATRRRRIERTCEELIEGKKRPCCWVGCIHRADKTPSPWQQAVLIDQKAKSRT